MNDRFRDPGKAQVSDLPVYEAPKITVMRDEEVLKAFQMTALEISAAGCWWAASSWS